MQNYVPLNDIHIFTITHRRTVCVSATPPRVFGIGISNLLNNSDMHLTCAYRKQNFDPGHN